MAGHISAFNTFVLGLGLFFLGLNLVSENLKLITSGRLRTAVSAATRRPMAPAAIGLCAGALMQSATAVTFICVSMASAGLLTALSAAGLIVWSNVGLTALAFVATLNIDPTVAIIVGASGVVLGVVRVRLWQTFASVLLGVGLILMGLHLMSGGAQPLSQEGWFQNGIAFATSSVLLTFFAGVLAAALLQSNTGATMMIMTLSAAGALKFQEAALLIYGTNLGAIPLRVFLASGLRGESFRLVRVEDLFCIASGAVMLGLFALEAAGVPLVFAFVSAVSESDAARLVLVFLLSNLLPAALLTPALPACLKLLGRTFPSEAAETVGRPKYLAAHALGDPHTALQLLRKELARLAGLIAVTAEIPGPGAAEESAPSQDFARLSAAIQDFAVKLASRSSLSEEETQTLHGLRTILSGLRHVEEAARFYAIRASDSAAIHPTQKEDLDRALAALLADARAALDSADEAAARELHEKTKSAGEYLTGLRCTYLQSQTNIESAALAEDCRLFTWTLHRFSKLLLALFEK